MTFSTGQTLTAADLSAATERVRKFGRRSSTTNVSNSTTDVGAARIDGIVLKGGETVKAWYAVHRDSSSASDKVEVNLRYNASGNATTTSTTIPGSRTDSPVGTPMYWQTYWEVPADGTYSIALTFHRSAGGSGNATLFVGSPERDIQFGIEPKGEVTSSAVNLP